LAAVSPDAWQDGRSGEATIRSWSRGTGVIAASTAEIAPRRDVFNRLAPGRERRHPCTFQIVTSPTSSPGIRGRRVSRPDAPWNVKSFAHPLAASASTHAQSVVSVA
jgi:hypothetical protein